MVLQLSCRPKDRVQGCFTAVLINFEDGCLEVLRVKLWSWHESHRVGRTCRTRVAATQKAGRAPRVAPRSSAKDP